MSDTPNEQDPGMSPIEPSPTGGAKQRAYNPEKSSQVDVGAMAELTGQLSKFFDKLDDTLEDLSLSIDELKDEAASTRKKKSSTRDGGAKAKKGTRSESVDARVRRELRKKEEARLDKKLREQDELREKLGYSDEKRARLHEKDLEYSGSRGKGVGARLLGELFPGMSGMSSDFQELFSAIGATGHGMFKGAEKAAGFAKSIPDMPERAKEKAEKAKERGHAVLDIFTDENKYNEFFDGFTSSIRRGLAGVLPGVSDVREEPPLPSPSPTEEKQLAAAPPVPEASYPQPQTEGLAAAPVEPIVDLSSALGSLEGKEDVAHTWGRFLFAVPEADILETVTNIEGYKPLLARSDEELESLAEYIEKIRDAFVMDGSVSMLDEDKAQGFKAVGEGASVIMEAFGDDPARAERASEAFKTFFSNAGDIPEEAMTNLESISGIMIKAAVGLAAMAGALFIVAMIPMPDALIGMGAIAAAATVLGIAGGAGNLIIDGGIALGVASVGLGLSAISMLAVSAINPLTALAGLGTIAVAAKVAAASGAVSTNIMLGAAALALLAPALYLTGWAMEAVADIDAGAALAGLGVITVAGVMGAAAGIAAPLIIPGAIALAALGIGLIPITNALSTLDKIDPESSEKGVEAISSVLKMGIMAGLTAPLLLLGAYTLPVLGAGFFVTAGLISSGLNQFARVPEEGIESYQTFMGTVTTFSRETDMRNLMFGILQLPLLSSAIIGAGFALRFLGERSVDNFVRYMDALIELAAIPGIGGILKEVAAGIEAVNDAMSLGVGGWMMQAVQDVLDTADEAVRNWLGLDERKSPFQIYIDLANAGDIGPALISAAEGIEAVDRAMAGDGSILGAVKGAVVGTIERIDRFFSGSIKAYEQLAAMGTELFNAGRGVEALAEGFNRLDDFNVSALGEVALSIKDFAETIGREDLMALADIFSHSVRLHTGAGGAGATPSGGIPDPPVTTSIEDGFVYRDGTVVELDPMDNVYATVNDLHTNEINAGYREEVAYTPVEVDMSSTNRFLDENVNTLEKVAEVMHELQEAIKVMTQAKTGPAGVGGQDSAAPTIISINQGYKTNGLLESSV